MTKISPEFSARLRRLDPEKRVRAIVLLDLATIGVAPAKSRSRGDRQAVIEAMSQAAAPVLDDIDRILDRDGGRRLARDVSALGAVPVETTAAGARGLAALEQVKAVIEDQPISTAVMPQR